jgi:CubicO group peptidase (beta-lactamase class C family)
MQPMIRALALAAAITVQAQAQEAAPYAQIDALMQRWRVEQHVPGMVWAVVAADGRILHSGTAGVANTGTQAAVTLDTRFRIASMTKAFTGRALLGLRDAGKLRLDDPVALHVPEMAGWAGGITVNDLVHHMAGFVTDDPWGDRQTPLPESDFTAMLKRGVAFTRAPGMAHEYSNFGYATLGRIIGNVSGEAYDVHVARTIFRPLGMAATTFHIGAVPRAQLAVGYRWQDGAWVQEPELAHGAFGAMGGVITTAHDYARWMGHLLSAWPAPVPGANEDPARATLRFMTRGEGQPRLLARPGSSTGCRVAQIYGVGLRVAEDCSLGHVAYHSGGYPGYGSHMLLIPDAGVGLFLFTNRTYAPTSGAVWDAALILQAAGMLTPRSLPVSPALAAGQADVARIWAAGRIEGATLAGNFTMDRDAAHWATDLAALKAQAGACPASETGKAPVAQGALEGRFRWQCAAGTVSGHVLLAPTGGIQALDLAVSAK